MRLVCRFGACCNFYSRDVAKHSSCKSTIILAWKLKEELILIPLGFCFVFGKMCKKKQKKKSMLIRAVGILILTRGTFDLYENVNC